MPFLDGQQVCKAVRKRLEGLNLEQQPLIVLSSADDNQLIKGKRSKEKSIFDLIIAKPITLQKLDQILE